MKNAYVEQMGQRHKADERDTHASNTECMGREPRSLNLQRYITHKKKIPRFSNREKGSRVGRFLFLKEESHLVGWCGVVWCGGVCWNGILSNNGFGLGYGMLE